MWDVIQVGGDAVRKVGTYSTVEECGSRHARTQGILYVWAGAYPTSEAEQLALVESVANANDGADIRLTVGMNFSAASKVSGLTGCSGSCFCVIANGMRRCEAQYCNQNGYCWWVPCSSNC